MAREKKPGGPKDVDGREIPPHLVKVFNSSDLLKDLADDLESVHADAIVCAALNPQTFQRFDQKAFAAKIKQAQQIAESAIPHIVCPYCGGDHSKDCKSCKGAGFLSRAQALCVPAELRGK